MAKGHGKGSAFEREISRQLSLWWSTSLCKKPRDDLFWRATTSGARATMRSRQNKRTAGSYGDIAAVDPIGKPLIDAVTIELKKGYPTSHLGNLIDAPDIGHGGMFEKWIKQAERSHQQAGSYSWLLISQRNRRNAVVTMPFSLWCVINDATEEVLPQRGCHLWMPATPSGGYRILTLDHFFMISPEIFVEIAKM